MSTAARPSRTPRFIAVLSFATLLAGATSALEGRFGTYVAEGPGAWLQVRHPLAGTDFGIHLAASTIRLDVLRYNEAYTGTLGSDPTAPRLIPSEVTGLFYEWGVVVSRGLHRSDRWCLALSTGILGGLLDGTQDESMRPVASTMILVPVFAETDWHPWTNHPRLGVTFGAGGVWTIPGDEENLYPEVSAWRWQARTGLVF